jgi:hypothetical protein
VCFRALGIEVLLLSASEGKHTRKSPWEEVVCGKREMCKVRMVALAIVERELKCQCFRLSGL